MRTRTLDNIERTAIASYSALVGVCVGFVIALWIEASAARDRVRALEASELEVEAAANYTRVELPRPASEGQVHYVTIEEYAFVWVTVQGIDGWLRWVQINHSKIQPESTLD